MTQVDLAERAGTSGPTISVYEHGARHPRADVLLRVLRAAGGLKADNPLARLGLVDEDTRLELVDRAHGR